MPQQLSAVVLLLVCLAVNFHCGCQISTKTYPEIRKYLQSTTAGATENPSLLQTTSQVPHRTARSTDGHDTSQIPVTTSKSERATTHTAIKTPATTTPVTTESTPSTSPINHTLLTTQATANISKTATPVTEATIGPSSAPRSLPSTVTPPAHTAGSSPSNVSHTAGNTTQCGNQTTLPTALSTAPRSSTTSQTSTRPTPAPGTTTAPRTTTHTATPTTTAPGPTLAPQPSPAKTGIYRVLNGSELCIKAEMGIELILQEKESVFSPLKYFNIDPNVTQASGNCDLRKSNLLLNFQGGFVNFTFTKGENSYYISEVGAYLTISNPEKTYQGMKSAMMMFETMIGHSFKCVSKQSITLSPHLHLKTMNVQLQAFDFEGDNFGNVDECSSDYTIVLPVIGAIVLGLCAVGLIVYGLRLRRESSGYQRI
ncbi:lysosome-associated membrane glycoprotein 3 isoform X2 [Choloepus didactylus]|uniref:lysosome-associated membrane glycoprotein 3 isoform X2 n=1 Tax=Choloepus didactylus TaxID=27675 RepID=UPI00189C65A5|nr:lysosome-associated membrane glycoprotein 3 isoform X2 [Choloepus didactylus]